MKTWKGYQHGVDLGGWFSQCNHTRERYEHFITREDIRTIASWGLDHVRVPVDYNLVGDEKGEYREEGFRILQRVIDWCGESGLNMVLDLHKTWGFSFDEGEREEGFFDSPRYQEMFYALWEEFARRYAGAGERIAFELLNEVTDQAYSDRWNRIADTCIRRIRAIAPEVCILVGGYWNNSIDAMPDLGAPQDANIIYNFHCYDPLIFTHQGAPWVRGMDPAFRISMDAPVSKLAEETAKLIRQDPPDFAGLNPEEAISEEYFVRRFRKAVQVAEERNVRLYCGEYGVIDRAEPEDALKWYRAISAAFDRFGIGRAAWSYRAMDFGIADERMDRVRAELIRLL